MKVVALIVMLALPSALALDFAPRVVKEVGEGGEYSYLRFRDGERFVTYLPPRGWDYFGGGHTFRLTPPHVGGAEVEMTWIPMEEPPVAGEDSFEAFAALALESLPKGAAKIESPVARFNPCELDGCKTVEVTLSYVMFGQPVTVSRLYLPRTADLLRFTVVSHPNDFERLRKVFLASLHTLAGLQSDPSVP